MLDRDPEIVWKNSDFCKFRVMLAFCNAFKTCSSFSYISHTVKLPIIVHIIDCIIWFHTAFNFDDETLKNGSGIFKSKRHALKLIQTLSRNKRDILSAAFHDWSLIVVTVKVWYRKIFKTFGAL
ncbi:unnamed protein product [Ceratitis capitata]|uniref:(Mediterranean fruit fly) hypothetical protein n=1 Tax=Ceratitis capitata TaxID=7213 RepID=A0A811UEM8_CERCA|nr:unnamed protein product [Ceratitis capitata]